MIKQINITFTYNDTPEGFEPLTTEVDNADHRALAFCIAGILHEANKINNCFSSHVAEDITEIKKLMEE